MSIFSKDDFEDIAKELHSNLNKTTEMNKQMEVLRKNAVNLVIQTLDIYLEAAKEYVGQAPRFGIASKTYSTDNQRFFARKTPSLYDIGYGYFMAVDGELWKKNQYYNCAPPHTVFSLQSRETLKQDVSKIVNTPTIYSNHCYTAPSFSQKPSTWGEIRRFTSKLAEALLLITFECSYSLEMGIRVDNYYGDYDACSAHIGTQRDNSVIQSLIRDVFPTRIGESQTITNNK